jgi:hypothetical protein
MLTKCVFVILLVCLKAGAVNIAQSSDDSFAKKMMNIQKIFCLIVNHQSTSVSNEAISSISEDQYKQCYQSMIAAKEKMESPVASLLQRVQLTDGKNVLGLFIYDVNEKEKIQLTIVSESWAVNTSSYIIHKSGVINKVDLNEKQMKYILTNQSHLYSQNH